MGNKWIAGLIIAGMLSASPIITAAIIKVIPRNTNGMSERLGAAEQGLAATKAQTKAQYGEILRRLDRIEDKMP